MSMTDEQVLEFEEVLNGYLFHVQKAVDEDRAAGNPDDRVLNFDLGALSILLDVQDALKRIL